MTNHTNLTNQTSDRTSRRLGRWSLAIAAACLVGVSGLAAAQVPALPIAFEHQTAVSTPAGSLSAQANDRSARVCTDGYVSAPAFPVPLPISALPSASARSCAGADLDQLRVDADAAAQLRGLQDPTGLIPTGADLAIGADADDRELDTDAHSDSSTVQKVMDNVNGAVQTAWRTIRDLV